MTYAYDPTSALIGLFGILIFAVIILFIFKRIFPISEIYRKEIADMYIVAKIKNLAKKEGLDLDKEYCYFEKMLSKSSSKTIDRKIEEELMDKLNEKGAK